MPVQRKSAPAPKSAPPQPRSQQQANQRASQTTPAPGQGFASLNPDDFTSGGLLDDVDVTFNAVRFTKWDYNGSTDPVLALMVEMGYEDNGKEATLEQYYSAGDLNRFEPSDDGCRAVSVSGARGLNSNTNAALFLKSVIDNGFPVDKFGDGDVSQLDGMRAHINRIPQPTRGGGIANKNAQGYDKTVAVVTKIIQMPWETGPAVGTSSRASVKDGGKPNGEAATADELDSPIAQEAAEIVQKILIDKKGSVAKSGLTAGAFKHLAGNKNRSEILKFLTNDEFLSAYFTFDGKTVKA